MIAVIAFASCKKDNIKPLLQGLYIETEPMKGVSQMKFLNNSLVVYSIAGTSVADTFKVSYKSAKIFLTPNWSTQNPTEFELVILGENSFKIPNRHLSSPIAPIPYMVFER